MLVCSTEEPESPEKEAEIKPKRSGGDKPDKVDKKFLWNHGSK